MFKAVPGLTRVGNHMHRRVLRHYLLTVDKKPETCRHLWLRIHSCYIDSMLKTQYLVCCRVATDLRKIMAADPNACREDLQQGIHFIELCLKLCVQVTDISFCLLAFGNILRHTKHSYGAAIAVIYDFPIHFEPDRLTVLWI